MPVDGYVLVPSKEEVIIHPVDPEITDYILHINHIRAHPNVETPTYRPHGVLMQAGQILGKECSTN